MTTNLVGETCTGENVVIIGSGATAFTVAPTLAETAKHVTILQRSPTYVAYVPVVGSCLIN